MKVNKEVKEDYPAAEKFFLRKQDYDKLSDVSELPLS